MRLRGAVTNCQNAILQAIDQKGISEPKRQNLHDGYEYPVLAWSIWRRRHQYRAQQCHYRRCGCVPPDLLYLRP